MKNKGLIFAFSCVCIFVVALITTIIVLASGNQNVGSNLSLIYVASEIGGSVSGTYKVGDNPAKDMTNDSGAKVVNFGSDQPTTLSLLSPNETINLLYGESLILTYTFTNSGEEYYANMSYSDTDTPYTNLVFSYKKENDSDYSTTGGTLLTVPRLGTATFSVKISIDKAYLNASLKGTIDWALVKEKTQFLDEKVSLSFANNDGTVISPSTFSYDVREKDGKAQFKIVGATPVIDSTSTSGHINGYYDRTTLASTGKVSSIDDLTNSNGAEFFYFCTNPAVVGSTSYNDPGTIYYTSTSDSTLENWYDIPSSETQLYACFMTPNYTSEVQYRGSDTQIVISNKVTNILYKAFYNKSSITDVAIPQSVKNIGYGTSLTGSAFYGCSSLKSITIPNSVTSIGDSAFFDCKGLTSITIPNSVTSIDYGVFFGCSGLTSVTIPNGVTSIGDQAFYVCRGLTSVTIPDSVTSIGYNAFLCCSGLTSITIPDSVTSIGEGAFCNCSGLTSITIPNSVTSIGHSAFYIAGASADNNKIIYDGTLENFKSIANWSENEPTSCFDSGSEPIPYRKIGTIKVITNDNPTGVTFDVRNWSCLSIDTEITCYDEKRKRWYKKKLRDLTYKDKIVVWNFDEGKFDVVEPIFLTRTQVATRYTVVKLSDGAVLKLIGENDSKRHRMFVKETGRFDYVNKSLIGKTTFNEKGEFVKIIDIEYVNGEIEFANIITKYHFNCFANGILTSCRLSNMYKIENMKYVKDNRELRPISDFKGVEEKYYDGLRLAEQPYNICQGQGDARYVDYVDFVNSWKNNSK